MFRILFFLLLVFITNLSAQHPNLENETIVLDKEALKTINDYKNPNENMVLDSSPNSAENIIKAKKIKTDLVKAFKPVCKLFLEEEYRFFGLTNDNQLIKISVPISGKEIDAFKYRVNKKIISVDELILVTQMFSNAYWDNITFGVWKFEYGECKYDDTIYNQFRFTDIRYGVFHDVESLIKKYLE